MFKKILAVVSAASTLALATISTNAWWGPLGFGFPFGFGFGFPFGW